MVSFLPLPSQKSLILQKVTVPQNIHSKLLKKCLESFKVRIEDMNLDNFK